MTLGAHVSAAGGYSKAIERAQVIGADALQIFSGSPRAWKQRSVTLEEKKQFKELYQKAGMKFACFHAIYLTNLADTGSTGEKTEEALITELTLASELGIAGSVVHTGSYKVDGRTDEKYKMICSRITKILKKTPKDSLLILENAGNRKIGEKIEELAEIIEDIGSPRVHVCLDTCHLHAAGYDLRDRSTFDTFLDYFDKLIGLEKLTVIHLNDSKDPQGSLRDRHENLTKGEVGESVFRNFLTSPLTKDKPFILEVPGFDGNGPDAENIALAKKLVK